MIPSALEAARMGFWWVLKVEFSGLLGGSSQLGYVVSNPIYKPFRPFVRGTTLLRGLTNHGY